MLRHFRSDARGVAAVEFALVAPVMILLYMGLAELTLAVMAERRANHAASVIADLVAQRSQIKGSELSDVFQVGGAILSPFPATSLKMRVTSITADAQASPKVVWSQASGMGGLTAGATATGVPSSLLAAGDSLIMTEVSYSFDSPLKQVLPNAIGFSNTYFLKPRRSPTVALLPG